MWAHIAVDQLCVCQLCLHDKGGLGPGTFFNTSSSEWNGHFLAEKKSLKNFNERKLLCLDSNFMEQFLKRVQLMKSYHW